jgi:hypothetical protein
MPERAITMNWNWRSHSNGMRDHNGPDYAPELSDAARSCGGGGRLTTYCERNQELRLWRHRIRIIASAEARAWLGGAGRAVV